MIFKEPEELLLELPTNHPAAQMRGWEPSLCKSRPGFLSHSGEFFFFFLLCQEFLSHVGWTPRYSIKQPMKSQLSGSK